MGYSKAQVEVIGVIFMILPAIFVVLRVISKLKTKTGLKADDWTILVALAFNTGCCAVVLLAAEHGQLAQSQAKTPDGMPILDDPRFLVYERSKFALNMLTYAGYGFSKLSMLFLYLRIFDVRRSFRYLLRGMLVLVTAWTIAFVFGSLFQCWPVTPLIDPFYGKNCVNGIGLWYTGAITDIVIDFTILAIPIEPVRRLNMDVKKKIVVVGMFLTGALACCASVVRLVVYLNVGRTLREHFNDATYFTTPVFIWSVIELSLAVISACLPTLRPILTLFAAMPSPFTTLRSVTKRSQPSSTASTSSTSTHRRGFRRPTTPHPNNFHDNLFPISAAKRGYKERERLGSTDDFVELKAGIRNGNVEIDPEQGRSTGDESLETIVLDVDDGPRGGVKVRQDLEGI